MEGKIMKYVPFYQLVNLTSFVRLNFDIKKTPNFYHCRISAACDNFKAGSNEEVDIVTRFW